MTTHGQLLIAVMQARIEQQAGTIAQLRAEAHAMASQLWRARVKIDRLESKLRLAKRKTPRGTPTKPRYDRRGEAVRAKTGSLPGELFGLGGILEE